MYLAMNTSGLLVYYVDITMILYPTLNTLATAALFRPSPTAEVGIRFLETGSLSRLVPDLDYRA